MTFATFTVDSSFGYVVLTLIVALLEVLMFGGLVGQQRKVCKVPYPRMTSTNVDDGFSRAMRVHYNAVEGLGLYVVFQIFCGLWWPMFSVVGGAMWIVGRALYAKGYMQAPEKRGPGALVLHIGELMLLIGSIAFALTLIRA